MVANYVSKGIPLTDHDLTEAQENQTQCLGQWGPEGTTPPAEQLMVWPHPCNGLKLCTLHWCHHNVPGPPAMIN